MVIAYCLAMIVVALAAWICREKRIFAVSAVLVANWIVNTAGCYLFDDNYPYWWFGCIDYLSGYTIVILIPLATASRIKRWELVVTIFFAAQMVWHAYYALSDKGAWVAYRSYYFLSFSAWLQLAVVAGWIGHECLNRYLANRRRAFADLALRRDEKGRAE